ncbi:hypothetical protein XELAEV_18000358mg [Xenopus laevis]|uniref:Uncharacterized protein n=1 Tax=Xenopus laevis TaxID=8355 RepID=A0A974BQG8_XENLA|nr:hypothetical protein XELAEV_18000358mg [Xenopus laevis]
MGVPEGEAARIAGKMAVTGPLSSDSSHEAPPPYIVKDGGVEASAPRPTMSEGKTYKALRTDHKPWRTSSGSPLPSVPISPVVQDSIARVDSWLGPHSAGVSEGAPWEEDWEADYEESEREPSAAVAVVPPVVESTQVVPEPGRCRSPPVSVLTFSASSWESIYHSPQTLMVNDESTFWVLPGKALQQEFLAVSKRWGFYMPYTPEYVYTEVEKNLEKWVRQDILASLKLDEYSLVHPDSTTRQDAKQKLENAVPLWWQGRTVMRHHVRSVTKRDPERHLSVDVPLEGGGTVEKPHPRYYISFVNTKNWFIRMI